VPENGNDAGSGEDVAEAAPRGEAASDLHVEMLREIAESATREVEPERLLAASLRPVARAAGARAAGLFLIDNVTGLLARETCADGIDSERAELPRDRGLTGACLSSGAVVATDHPERDPRYDPDVDTPEGGATGPLVVVPLQVRGRVLGVVRIFPSPEVGASARLAELVAAPLSAATRNVLLYRSLLESVEDVARARREAGTAGAPGRRT
jgi:transcriptional regulator with GAF, ATPase, and Fis domain